MGKRIVITTAQVTAEAELNDSASAAAIFDALPIEAKARTWGEEVYFDIGLALPPGDDAREDVRVGEIGYWPTGRAFCIFFGPTPASGPDGAPRAASAVNPVGRVVTDPSVFRGVAAGGKIVLSGAG